MKLTKKHQIQIKRAFCGINREELAKKVVRSGKVNIINQIAVGLKVVSAVKAREIERATSGQVPASVLRPDIFK